MIKRIFSILVILSLLLGTAFADSKRNALYTYPSSVFQATTGRIPSHPERYVNQFFRADGSYSAKGEALLTWLDMEKPEGSIINTGYLMLERQYDHQMSTGQSFGHFFRWIMDRGAETVSSFGLNLFKSAVNHSNYKTKFGPSGAYAVPYYEMLKEVYASYTDTLKKRMNAADNSLKILSDIISPVYNSLNLALEETVDEILVTSDINLNYYHMENAISYMVTGVSRNARMEGLPAVTHIEISSYDKNGKLTTSTMTLDELTAHTIAGKKVILHTSKLSYEQREFLKSSIKADVQETNILKFDDDYWYRRMTKNEFQSYMENIYKSEAYQKLTDAEKEDFKNTMQAREATLRSDAKAKLGKIADTASIALDLVSAIDGWYNYFSGVHNLTLSQQAYLQSFADVSLDYLVILANWNEAILNDGTLSDTEKEHIRAALIALMNDITESCTGNMEAVVRENVKLGSFSSLTDAVNNTADFIVSVTGLSAVDPLSGLSSLSGAMLVAKVTDIAITFMGGEQYFDAYEKVKTLYTLQASFTKRVTEQLEYYALHRSEALAKEIINGLTMIRTMKLVGEEVVLLYYLSDFAMQRGLDKAPAMYAVLIEEILNASSAYDLDALGAAKKIYGVYARQSGIDETIIGLHSSGILNEEEYNRNPLSVLPQYHFNTAGDVSSEIRIEDTVLGYYRMTGDPVSIDTVALEALPDVYKSRIGALPAAYKDPPLISVPFGRLSILPGSYTYFGIVNEDATWRSGMLSEKAQGANVFVQNVYLYQKGETQVIFTEKEFDIYVKIENEVEQLLKQYSSGDTQDDYRDHQDEERLMFGRQTRRYIDSIDMYDINAVYPINPVS